MTDANSDTPRTNKEATCGWSGDAVCVSDDFARTLERELNAWRAYAERLATAGDAVSAHAPDDAYRRWFAAKETKP